MSRWVRSVLLDTAMAMMEAVAGATMTMRCSGALRARAAMHAAPDVTQPRLARPAANAKARPSVYGNLRNSRRGLGRKLWQVVWHQPARGRRRTHDIGLPRFRRGRCNRGGVERETEHEDRTQHNVTAGETPACGHVPSSLRHLSPGPVFGIVCAMPWHRRSRRLRGITSKGFSFAAVLAAGPDDGGLVRTLRRLAKFVPARRRVPAR